MEKRSVNKSWRDIQAIFSHELAGGFILIIATVLALFVANSKFSHHYFSLWQLNLGITLDRHFIGFSIKNWVNDVLMSIFFLLVGLEIKREFLVGELNELKKASFPIVGALGGMVIPALIYFALNFNTPYAHGFGIPMATDIAFAMGVILLLGRRVPVALKVFLVALAVVDDLGAILVIAFFYTAGSIGYIYLVGAAVILGILSLLNYLGVKNLLPYLALGVVLWIFIHEVGVHPTISAVLLAFCVPLSDKVGLDSKKSPLKKLEHSIHGASIFLVMPIFAFANAGVEIDGHINFSEGHIFLGVFLGLLLGKPLGIFLVTYICDKIGIAKKPEDVGWLHIIGVGFLAGIGFTMSIFVSSLAFNSQQSIQVAKISILSASLIAAILGSLFLVLCNKFKS